MELNLYTDILVNELKTNINLNLDNYKNGKKFVDSFIPNYESYLYPVGIEVSYPILDKTISKKDDKKAQWQIDLENAITLHKNFVLKYKIPLKYLSDERFITYLTHDIYFDYMVTRWPIDDKHLNRIKEKYFLPSGNQAFTRNMFLRFFWYAYITYDANEKDPYCLTRIAFEYADPVNQIMERKYSKNGKIVRAALKAINNVKDSKILNSKRTLYGKAINNILGIYCLDSLSEQDLVSLFEGEIKNIITSKIKDNESIAEE